MSIAVEAVRTDSMKHRVDREQRIGISHIDACELCRKPVSTLSAVMVAIDHEQYEFVTEAEAFARGDSVSLFPVGPDCARRITRALKANS